MYAITKDNNQLIATHEEVEVLESYQASLQLFDCDIVKLRKQFLKKYSTEVEDYYLVPVKKHYTQRRFLETEEAFSSEDWEIQTTLKVLRQKMYDPSLSSKDYKKMERVLELLEDELSEIESSPVPLDTLKSMETNYIDWKHKSDLV